jgi:WD40 repeat protein
MLTVQFCALRGECYGLAAHPIRDEFVTVGDDGTVRIYDLITRRLLRMTKLAGPARCVTYSPDGTRIAVGMGAPEPAVGYNHWQAAAALSGEVTHDL